MDYSKFNSNLPRIHMKNDEDYFRRFSYLAKCDNNMVIFTYKKYEDRIMTMRQSYNTKIIFLDNRNMKKWYDLFLKFMIYTDINNKIIENKKNMYEYVSPQYNVIVHSKLFFLKYTCNSKLFPEENIVMWIDFGCFYDYEEVNHLFYPFPKDKITLFSISNRCFNSIHEIVSKNEPFVNGSSFVVPRHMGNLFFKEYKKHTRNLIFKERLISDDEDALCYMVMNNRQLYNLIPISQRMGGGYLKSIMSLNNF